MPNRFVSRTAQVGDRVWIRNPHGALVTAEVTSIRRRTMRPSIFGLRYLHITEDSSTTHRKTTISARAIVGASARAA